MYVKNCATKARKYRRVVIQHRCQLRRHRQPLKIQRKHQRKMTMNYPRTHYEAVLDVRYGWRFNELNERFYQLFWWQRNLDRGTCSPSSLYDYSESVRSFCRCAESFDFRIQESVCTCHCEGEICCP